MAAEERRMQRESDCEKRDAESDREPGHVLRAKSLTSGNDRRPGEKRGGALELGVTGAEFAEFARVLMQAADNPKRAEGAEKSDVAQPSVHKQVSESKQDERDE